MVARHASPLPRIAYAFDRTPVYITGGLASGRMNTNPLTGNTLGNAG
ncbi:hypothetical protein [Bosea sp. NBC_00550]|nr:hypothetical protein [Bosea sp. NBC_00550]UZF92680.1 hypothetical protein NWE53_00170 [Bosea sp. NBC_00550]